MSYTKHNWVNGETITDTLLNHMEDGIAAGGGSNVFVVGASILNTVVLDKTWEQIKQEFESGKIGFILVDDDGTFFIQLITEVDQSDGYVVTALRTGGGDYYVAKFIAQQPSDYPVEEIFG